MKGSPMHRNYGIGSPAKQAAKPDTEGEKKVMEKRNKAIEDHNKNAPKTTNTQEQADNLNKIQQGNVDAYNTSNDSIQNVHNLYNADVDKQNAVIDSTNTANKAAYDKYLESTKKKKKSPAKQTTSDKVKRPHLYDDKPKNGKPDSYNGPRSKGGLKPRANPKGPRDGMKVTDVKKYSKKSKKSPAKCPLVAALAPMAIKAVGGAIKNKREENNAESKG